jgi:hypothetical protein
MRHFFLGPDAAVSVGARPGRAIAHFFDRSIADEAPVASRSTGMPFGHPSTAGAPSGRSLVLGLSVRSGA